MADGPVLVVKEGPLRGRVVHVEEGGLSIGRSPENAIVVEHEDASRFHARLLYDNGSLWLRDIGSRNGVFVNEERLDHHRGLKVGDLVRIADTVFEVQWAPQAEGMDEPGSASSVSDARRGPRGLWWWPFGSGTRE